MWKLQPRLAAALNFQRKTSCWEERQDSNLLMCIQRVKSCHRNELLLVIYQLLCSDIEELTMEIVFEVASSKNDFWPKQSLSSILWDSNININADHLMYLCNWQKKFIHCYCIPIIRVLLLWKHHLLINWGECLQIVAYCTSIRIHLECFYMANISNESIIGT